MTSQRALAPRERRRVARKQSAPPALQHLLVISSTSDRARMIAKPAAKAGWNVIACQTAAEATKEVFRNRIAFVVVDLDGVDREEEESFRSFAEQIASGWGGGSLLAILGPEEDATGEIWSRQLGAWLYLPGVDEASDLSAICCDARIVADRLQKDLVAVV